MNAPAQALSLIELAEAYRIAKHQEDLAIATRRQIGELIAQSLPGTDEGTVTETVGSLKVSVARGLTRSVDSDTLTAAWTTLPPAVQAAFKWKAGLDLKQLRALESVAPDQYALAAAHVTAKPSSPTITVKEA
jgi:hypothetical protein